MLPEINPLKTSYDWNSCFEIPQESIVTSLELIRKFMIKNQNIISVNHKNTTKNINLIHAPIIIIHDFPTFPPLNKNPYTSMISQRFFPSLLRCIAGTPPDGACPLRPGGRSIDRPWERSPVVVLRKVLYATNIRSLRNGLKTLQSTNIPI